MRATTKSAVSRRFVALSTVKLKEWLAADLSSLDLLVIQIDGLRVDEHVLAAAVGIDGACWRWPWARRRTPPWSRRCWPTWSRAGLNRISPACSSLTGPRR